jgi:hypothetical protein
MNEATRRMVLDWLRVYHEDKERVARYMSRTLRIGSLGACRALIEEALEG